MACKQYSDDVIIPVLEKQIRDHPHPRDCINVRTVAWEIMGCFCFRRDKKPIPGALTARIRELAAERGWYPDEADITKTAHMRLYKGGKR